MLRTLAERLMRGRTVRRRLPNGVPILVSPDAQLKYLGHTFDADLVRVAREHVQPGAVVWDIGANCGVFAFSCNQASRVIAVEADPFLAQVLRRSTEANRAPVEVVNCAIAESCGLASFSIARRGRASNHLSQLPGHSQTGGERGRITVATLTLDTLLSTDALPQFVKIDVEGAEELVLRGSAETLRRARPLLWLETSKHSHEACKDILDAHGYRLEHGGGDNWLCRPER